MLSALNKMTIFNNSMSKQSDLRAVQVPLPKKNVKKLVFMHCFFGILKARFENLTPSESGITLHYLYTVYNKRQCLLLIHWILLSKLFWKTIFIIQLFQWFHNNRPRSSEHKIHILHFHSNLHSEKLEATDNSMQLKAKKS